MPDLFPEVTITVLCTYKIQKTNVEHMLVNLSLDYLQLDGDRPSNIPLESFHPIRGQTRLMKGAN